MNELFAGAVLEEAGYRPSFVFIQDYHFALLPRILKNANPTLTMAQFWHIPWPNSETFRTFPWKEELLDGLLGNDLIGFHLSYDCVNFLERWTASSRRRSITNGRRCSGAVTLHSCGRSRSASTTTARCDAAE